MQSFRDVIIEVWRTPDALAADIGVPIERARKWRTRNNIPPEYWYSITKAARRKKKKLTVEDLARIALRRREDELSVARSPH